MLLYYFFLAVLKCKSTLGSPQVDPLFIAIIMSKLRLTAHSVP